MPVQPMKDFDCTSRPALFLEQPTFCRWGMSRERGCVLRPKLGEISSSGIVAVRLLIKDIKGAGFLGNHNESEFMSFNVSVVYQTDSKINF